MRKGLLILILTIFILTSAPAMAGGGKTDVNPIGAINFTDRVVYALDHTSDPDEGNWIALGCPYEGRRVEIPKPIKLTYSGPKYKKYGEASGTLYKDEDESYTITYPSTSRYCSHPVYLPGENVNMSFYGESGLKGEVEIYLFKVSSDYAYGLFDAFEAGDIGNLDNLFHNNMEKEDYKKYSNVPLGNKGDLLDFDFGPLDAGEYCIVMIQENKDGSLTALSATAFVVTEYELCIDAPLSIVKGEDLDISMDLKDNPKGIDYTYGAVLIREQAYKANIEINSDGTRNGTSVIINDIDIIDEFDIDSSNYRSKLTKNELQTEIQTLIGEGKGAIAIGEPGLNGLSLTAFDLPVGSYYLLVGAYSPEKGLVGLSQTKIEIKSKGSSNGGGSSGGSNGGGGSPEPAKNVKTKELCQQFVSNGNRIKFEFTKEATCVGYVEFNAKKTAGRITTIIEELKEKSPLTPTKPEGEVYKHLNIWVGNSGFANSNNIENSIVGFRVRKEWITENHINMDTIVLQHYSEDQWDSLKTEKVDEDDEYIYFEAETPGFSPFAITASKNILEIEEKTGGDESQSGSDGEQQDSSELVVGSDMSSKEKGNSVLKIASFFIGFLVIIAIGTIVKKKADQNDEEGNSEK